MARKRDQLRRTRRSRGLYGVFWMPWEVRVWPVGPPLGAFGSGTQVGFPFSSYATMYPLAHAKSAADRGLGAARLGPSGEVAVSEQAAKSAVTPTAAISK